MSAHVASDRATPTTWTLADAAEHLRVIVLAGVTLGVLVGGVGGRLAMMLLRATSPDTVVGLTSDDGFEIGQVTLAGSYNLLLVGAGIGLIGAAAYGLVAPWLIGPVWFRDLTAALGAGAVVGAMLVHADGIDFTVLEPTWLAIALFVAIPAAFGALVGPARSYAARPGTWASSGRRRWALPVVAVACFPPTTVVVLVIGAVVLVGSVLRASGVPQRLQADVRARTVIQGAWLAVALLGLVSLLGDIQDLV